MKKTFIVDRSKLVCGGNGPNKRGIGIVSLLNDSGFMCCLGHIAKQCELEDRHIARKGMPDCINREDRMKLNGILIDPATNCDNKLSTDAAEINDDAEITQRTRERRLIARFKEDGIKLKFVGRTVRSAY